MGIGHPIRYRGKGTSAELRLARDSEVHAAVVVSQHRKRNFNLHAVGAEDHRSCAHVLVGMSTDPPADVSVGSVEARTQVHDVFHAKVKKGAACRGPLVGIKLELDTSCVRVEG